MRGCVVELQHGEAAGPIQRADAAAADAGPLRVDPADDALLPLVPCGYQQVLGGVTIEDLDLRTPDGRVSASPHAGEADVGEVEATARLDPGERCGRTAIDRFEDVVSPVTRGSILEEAPR